MSSTMSPPSRAPVDVSEYRFHHISSDTEWAESYYPGGYHPVYIHDTFKSGRYKIIRKLGYGAFSTVWLARDNSERCYVALKIIVSKQSSNANELMVLQHIGLTTATDKASKNVVGLLDSFYHTGSNGNHLCLVFAVMGPNTTATMTKFKHPEQWDGWFPPWASRRLAKQVLIGLAYLHRNGVVHTDLQPGNVLFSLPANLDPLPSSPTPEPVRTILSEPPRLSPPVTRLDGLEDPWAPAYLAIPQPLGDLADISPRFRARISDLGSAHLLSRASENTELVTPTGLRAPEVFLKNAEGELNWDQSIDIWALGCLIFEWTTAQTLFAIAGFGMDDNERDDEHLIQMCGILGQLPDDLKARWGRWDKFFDEDGKYLISDIEISSLEKWLREDKHQDMTEQDVEALLGLLRLMLHYDPKQRPTAEELLEHEWFKSIDVEDEEEPEHVPEQDEGETIADGHGEMAQQSGARWWWVSVWRWLRGLFR